MNWASPRSAMVNWEKIQAECEAFDASATNQHLRKEVDEKTPPVEELSELELFVCIMEEWKWDFSVE